MFYSPLSTLAAGEEEKYLSTGTQKTQNELLRFSGGGGYKKPRIVSKRDSVAIASIYGTIELHTLKIVVLHGTRHDTLRLSFVPSEALSVCVCRQL